MLLEKSAAQTMAITIQQETETGRARFIVNVTNCEASTSVLTKNPSSSIPFSPTSPKDICGARTYMMPCAVITINIKTLNVYKNVLGNIFIRAILVHLIFISNSFYSNNAVKMQFFSQVFYISIYCPVNNRMAVAP